MRNILQLFSVLLKWSRDVGRSRSTFIFAALAGVVAGLGSTMLIAVINSVLAHGASVKTVSAFIGLCVLIPLGGFVSQALLVRLTAQASRDLRIRLSRQILAAPYRLLEEIGIHRLLATITDDIPSVTTGITSLPLLGTQFAVIAGCLVYLGWLSWPLLLLVLGYMVLGILTYQLPTMKSVHHFRLMREDWDASFKGFRALTEGTKELKLNRDRRAAFMSQELEPAIDGVYRHGALANIISTAASNWGQILFFVFIGLILFLTPRLVTVDHQALTGYTLTVLFMISPLSTVMNTFPILGRAHVAAEKVNALGLSLSAQSPEGADTARPNQSWNELKLSRVTHLYRQEETPDEFQLGPLDLVFHPGEIVFLIGGNGSGKTTLAKLLIGLYEPDSGAILLDGKTITLDNRDDYRQFFSVVFYDFFLFDRLYGLDHPELQSRSEEYLRQLQLAHKLRIENGKLSTIQLSQGQRKRLALLTAYLEDRPIYVFDEWASDQDPVFKQVFYREILADLKARGKTVIVISHDDRYYSAADRIIKLERGQIEYDKQSDASHFEVQEVPAAVGL
ncbi:MAG TPA: cyclic peptide export ABC transporter [Candidatus Angelobacter sp.]|jgi:putative ATP-binding cassette transporter|nr:cyclic peptide export ABC transporter [Candidatus Angelobacter sp.]